MTAYRLVLGRPSLVSPGAGVPELPGVGLHSIGLEKRVHELVLKELKNQSEASAFKLRIAEMHIAELNVQNENTELKFQKQISEMKLELKNQANDRISELKDQISEIKLELKDQAQLHMHVCERDITIVAVEVLKWTIGAQSQPDGDGRLFFTTHQKHEVKVSTSYFKMLALMNGNLVFINSSAFFIVQVGAQIFKRSVKDYRYMTRSVILDRNHVVHFGSIKVLDQRVEAAHFCIGKFRVYLQERRPREVDIIENYPALKKALPYKFQ